MLKFRARKLSRCPRFPAGCADTRVGAGQALTEMAELTEAAASASPQADEPVTDTQVLQRGAADNGRHFGYPVWLRPQDGWLGKGVAAQGADRDAAGPRRCPGGRRDGGAGDPVRARSRRPGARVHICRLSSAAGVAMLRAAKAAGLPVTADVSINSLHLTDVDIGYFNADMRLTPPLRQGADRDALRGRARRRHDRRLGVRP